MTRFLGIFMTRTPLKPRRRRLRRLRFLGRARSLRAASRAPRSLQMEIMGPEKADNLLLWLLGSWSQRSDSS